MMTILFAERAVRTPATCTHTRYLTKTSLQSTLGYTHGSSLSVDGAQATNSMVTQDTYKVFIQVLPPCGRVLTPFLGTCLGWQDKVAVRCLQSGLPMREKLSVTKSTGSNMVPMAR